MYNRYIPQPDGSFRRSRMKENLPEPQKPIIHQEPVTVPCQESTHEEKTCSAEKDKTELPCTPCRKKAPHARQTPRFSGPQQHEHRPEPKESSVTGFLRQLLPKDFDTGDLMIVLLLLLMSADCPEEQNTALLTLALYFFL